MGLVSNLRFGGAALLAFMVAEAGLADVKAGVDAWQSKDYAKAVAEWRKPAASGDPDAQFNLAQAYKLGRGVKADTKIARAWYQKAALQGHEQAQANLGLILFQNGERQAAMPWITRAAEQGEPRAQYVLGTALFNGDLASKDWPRAYAHMTRAAAAGLPQATSSLSQMEQYIPLGERQQGLALARDMERAPGGDKMIATPPPQPPAIVQTRPAPTVPRPDQVTLNASAPSNRLATTFLTKKPWPPQENTASAPPARSTIKAAPAPRPAPIVSRPEPVTKPLAPKPTAGGKWRVQLGAVPNAKAASDQWAKLKARPVLAGYQPFMVNMGTFTRLQAGPFASRVEAQQACSALKSAGHPCFPTQAP